MWLVGRGKLLTLVECAHLVHISVESDFLGAKEGTSFNISSDLEASS